MTDHQPHTPESDRDNVQPGNPWASEPPALPNDANMHRSVIDVPVSFENPTACFSEPQPVTLGLPIPRGKAGFVNHVALHNSVDTEFVTTTPVTIQYNELARWEGKSLRWVLVNFILPPIAPGKSNWFFRIYADDTCPEATTPIDSAQARSETENYDPSHSFAYGSSKDFLEVKPPNPNYSISARLLLTDSQGQTHAVSLQPETGNPNLSTGAFPTSIGLECRLRLTYFAEGQLVRAKITLHNPRRAHHEGGLWDLGDGGSIQFQSWVLKLSIESSEVSPREAVVAWQADPNDESPKIGQDVFIYQDSSGGENWRSPVHMNRSGRVPCQFRGYRAKSGSTTTTGLRANPTVAVRRGKLTAVVALPEFWQQFPLSLQANSSGIEIGLFPSKWSDRFELQGGEQKTHTVWMEFHNELSNEPASLSQAVKRLSNIVHSPVRARCSPEWYAHAEAMPCLSPTGFEGLHPTCQEIVHHAMEGEQSLFAKRETIDEYGWRNYGDVWADHEQAYFKGSGLVVSHYNNQFDMIAGGLRQFMQSGETAWWSFVAPLAQHVIDIDLYRTTQDRAAYNGGLFWFTDHYFSAATSTHRTYSRHNAPQIAGSKERSDYGGGPGSEHNFATGLLYYYWITGEPEAAEAVRMLADWVIAMDDGRQNFLGLLDEGPTGLASMSSSLDFQGPGRGAANSIEVLLAAWQLQQGGKYLSKCEEILRRVIHPADEIASLNLLDAEHRWSYTMFLSALVRYLEIVTELGGWEEYSKSYARESLLAYARWMAEHERPYLDLPEQLQFPTEAWAAQELRKANVLRQAARYEPDAMTADKMRRRGAELADRAWSDLQAFPTRQTARSVAIVMAEGTIDGYLRTNRASSMPNAATTNYNFGKPEAFVPQKLRIRNRSRSPLGIVQLLLSALRPAAWLRLLGIYNRHRVRKLR